MVLDGAAAKGIEFVTESTFGTFPSNPEMLGFGGYVNPASVKKTTVLESFPYLKGVGGSNRLQATEVVKTSEAFELSFEMRPVDWTMLPYVLKAANSSTYAIGDTAHNISFGLISGTEYQKVTGGVFAKYEWSVEEDKTAVVNLGAKASAVVAYGTDYKGSGTHAADPTGNVMKYGDLSSVTYDSAALSTNNAHLDGVKFGVEYDVLAIKDLANTAASKIGGWGFKQRNISLELGLSLDAMDLAADMLAGAAHTFAFTCANKTFTFSNVHWGGDWDNKLDSDDILGMELKASNVDLVIS